MRSRSSATPPPRATGRIGLSCPTARPTASPSACRADELRARAAHGLGSGPCARPDSSSARSGREGNDRAKDQPPTSLRRRVRLVDGALPQRPRKPRSGPCPPQSSASQPLQPARFGSPCSYAHAWPSQREKAEGQIPKLTATSARRTSHGGRSRGGPGWPQQLASTRPDALIPPFGRRSERLVRVDPPGDRERAVEVVDGGSPCGRVGW